MPSTSPAIYQGEFTALTNSQTSATKNDEYSAGVGIVLPTGEKTITHLASQTELSQDLD